jgi:uncharacterized protein YheU (UPF0270 family)
MSEPELNYKSEKEAGEIPIEISAEHLSPEILTHIIESFILREGTDYGWVETAHDKKLEQIRKQILKGEIKIIFDQTSETVSLLTDRDFKRLSGLSTL